jgi:N-acetylneuraminic acid mutarotase
VSDTWVTLEPMPTPRDGIAIAAYQGKIYCIGGTTAVVGSGWFYCGINEVYDVATDSWSTKASFPVDRNYLQAHVVDGKIFVINKADLYMYDPITDIWTEKTHLPSSGQANSISTVVEDKIMFFQLIKSSSKYSDSIKVTIYDPKTDMWSERETQEIGISANNMVVGVTTGVYAPQKVYIFDTYHSLIYDVENDVWSTTKSMTTPRVAFSVAVVDDVLYAIGGAVPNTGVTFLSVNEQYIPLGYHGTPSPVPSPVTSPSATPDSSDASKSFLIYIVVAALVVIIFGIVAALLLFKKGKKL